jgi:hypothetical protein
MIQSGLLTNLRSGASASAIVGDGREDVHQLPGAASLYGETSHYLTAITATRVTVNEAFA